MSSFLPQIILLQGVCLLMVQAGPQRSFWEVILANDRPRHISPSGTQSNLVIDERLAKLKEMFIFPDRQLTPSTTVATTPVMETDEDTTVDDATTVATESTTEAPETTAMTTPALTADRKIIINLKDIYHCPATGAFPVDGDCQRFLLCEQDRVRTNRILGRVFKCPTGYLFSTSGGRCRRDSEVACHRSNPLPRSSSNLFYLP